MHFLPQFLASDSFAGFPWLRLFSCAPAHRAQFVSALDRAEVLGIGRQLARHAPLSAKTFHRGPDPLTPGGGRDAVASVIHTMRPGDPALPPAWDHEVRLYVLLLLVRLYQTWNARSAAESGGDEARTHLARIMPALELCAAQSHPLERRTLAQAATACHFSVSHFRKLFRHTMGVTFGRFELRRRLGYAVELLSNTDLPVSAVALASGFTDASHLRRELRRHCSATPGGIRRHPQTSLRYT